ncbi:MAG: hypothetical protein KAS11_00620 [Candidatus Aenigmarchaeota archaeon]|nr:hypothetical protein [Candidatus Aenigmarchaeota archaeon]
MAKTTYLAEGMSYLKAAKDGIKRFDEWSDTSYNESNLPKILKGALDHLCILTFSAGSVADLLITGDFDLLNIFFPAIGLVADAEKNKIYDVVDRYMYPWLKYEDEIKQESNEA